MTRTEMEKFTIKEIDNGEFSGKSTFEIQSKPHYRNISFSSFQRPNSDQVVHDFGRFHAEDTRTRIFDSEKHYRKYLDHNEVQVERRIEGFEFCTNERLSSVSSIDSNTNYRTGSTHSTVTTVSEDSWNSKSGLCSNPPKIRRSPRRWKIRKNCPCFGKKSVDIEEKYAPNSMLNPNRSIKKPESPMKAGLDETDKRVKTAFLSAGRNSSEKEFSTEIIHQIISTGKYFDELGGFTFPILHHPHENPESIFDSFMEDIVSDSSSDLFEIESFSPQITSNHRRLTEEETPPGHSDSPHVPSPVNPVRSLDSQKLRLPLPIFYSSHVSR